jgi:mRNA-degrading endonuclease RelE of RelBE toxin-antitoxin system
MSFRFERTTRFERSVKRLRKRYPRVTADLIKAFEAIEANSSVGVVIPDDYSIRKLRVASSDMQRGKSGGFRLLYKLRFYENDLIVAVLLYLYAKVDQTDVSIEFLEVLDDDILEG